MIFLWIFLGILGLIALTLLIPVIIKISFREDFEAELRILFFKKKIYPLDEKEKKEKKPKTKAKTKKTKKTVKKKEKTTENKKPEVKFNDVIGLITDFLPTIGKYISKLLKSFLIYDVSLDIQVSDEDAAQTAIKTGQYNAFIYSTYSFFNNLFRMKRIKINIAPNFLGEETKINFDGKIRVIPLVILIIAFNLAIAFLIKIIKKKLHKTEKVKEKKKVVQNNESSN